MKDISIYKFATNLHFKKLTIEELKQGGSFNLVGNDGEFLAVVVVPISGGKKDQIQSLAHQMNVAIGK